ncbi:hypothetical protein MFLAVUS_005701 [Mucor flavus]|uniref:1-phosphatidylinositol-3-phosphate 5-kinase n=1 Tax=Mucor flavus TaxID=439312 RepID=A0ABP9YZG6_9FUNG
MDNKQRRSSLTSFNFQTPEDNINEEGVLSKIFDKVLSAVSGQPHTQDNCSVRTTGTLDDGKHSGIPLMSGEHSTNSIPNNFEQQQQLALPNSISTNSSLSRHLTTASSSTTTTSNSNKDQIITNFPTSIHPETVPRPSTSTTATTNTTITVGNQKMEQKCLNELNNNSTVQFIMPANRISQDDSRASIDFLLGSPLTKRRSIDSDTQSVATNFSISNSNSLSKILARLRGQKNDKEFWMPDEQCKECYKCRKPFTLLRRKHHCRTCGQIFCGRCASHVISGKIYKQKGQFRVCNFCYAEQLLQLKENILPSNSDTHDYPLSKHPSNATSMVGNNADTDIRQQQQLQQQQQNEHAGKSYNSNIIPSQKPPLAVPKMQIPATALRHTRSTYGNDDTTMFALEIPTHGSENYLSGSPQTSFLLERPHSSNTIHTQEQYSNNNTNDSPTLPHSNAISSANVIPTITTTNTSANESTASGGLKRLFDAGTSLLKSSTSSRPRSNTSSSAPMEDTRYPVMTQYGSPGTFRGNSNYPLPPYLLNRGGGTVLAESELSPFPGNNEDTTESYQDHLHPHYERPQLIPPSPPPPPPQPPIYGMFHTNSSQILPKSTYGDQLNVNSNQGNNSNIVATIGSDDESYDHRLRIKRTEELRGKNLPSRNSYNSLRRLSFAGNSGNTGANGNKKLFRNNLIRINTVGLPKSDFGSQPFNESWSPNPFINDGSQQNQTQSFQQETPPASKNRLRLPPRQRRVSGPPPQIVELSLSARTHARRILRQLMEEITLEDTSKSDWEEIIMSILLKVAHNVQPDISAGDDMDVRHYVKIKKIPGGVPSDSFYVKGVVCTKNVAHKRMMRNISNPRILILLFSLDYSRIEMENQLLSINPVITQEREHIKKLVGRIVALKPSLLVVKSTVSRLALEFLLEAKIPVIHNVKHSVIEAIARCTQASIVTSVDKLQHGLSFGRCGSFEIRTVMHEWIPNRRKTFLIFDNCSPELGGTIVLRGERDETLRVIKRLIDFMVFVVNSLKLETSLLLDSFAKSRGSTEINVGPTVPTSYLSETTKSPFASVLSESTKLYVQQSGESACATSVVEYEEDDGATINSHYTTALLKLYQNTILSVSQFVLFPPPYLLVALKETEDKLALINDQKRRKSASGSSILTTNTAKDFTAPLSASPTRSTFERQSIHSTDNSTLVAKTESSEQYYRHQHWHEEDVAIEAENDLIAKHRQISKAWEAYIGENPEFISPFYHQNIVVLFSSVCTVTTVPCQGPEIRIFSFYRFPSDKTLGQYITDFCTDAHQPCSSFMCDNPMLQHYRSYAHGNARVNVMIEPFACPLPGMQNKLLMWNYCKECDKPTPVLPVSENTWNYSFGKFLEIFFYQQGVYCRADICPHDMNRNHVRYFGYMNLAVRFQYDSIDLLEVTVPPMKLFILSKVQMDIKDAELALLRSKINKFYQSIIERNKVFPFDLVDPHKLDSCKTELQDMSTVAQGEKKDILQHVQNVYAHSDPYDTLTISGVRKHLFQIVSHWDAMYSDFVQYYLQPERELKKITANHLRKMFPTDISESAISNMDDERTKRATEATDLPLLGIGLDGEDDDTLIGHNYKRKFSTKADECDTKKSSEMLRPTLSSSPSNRNSSVGGNDDDQPSSSEDSVLLDSDHKGSFLRPKIRRRLSLELLNELNTKLKIDEGRSTGIEALNQITSNKFLRLKSPGSISAAFTPSRIPIPLYNANIKVGIPSMPPLYQLFNRRQRSNMNSFAASTRPSSNMVPRLTDKKGKNSAAKKDLSNATLPVKIPDAKMPRSVTSANIPQRGRHIRHHSIGHSQRLNHKSLFEQLGNRYDEDTEDDANEEDDPSTFLQRSITTRKFRSRLPRKKTFIQVYSRANDLVQEDIDDEFYASGDFPEDTVSIESTIKNKKKHHRDGNSSKKRYIEHPYGRKREIQAVNKSVARNFKSNGDEADNDDNDLSGDSGDDSDKSQIDYFSSLAPYTHNVIEGAAAVLAATSDKETIENQSLPTNLTNNEQQQYQFAKTYFPFSDGQLDMSSGLSGEEENDRDLPCASELLMDQQTNVDNMSIGDLRNIHPGIITDGLHSSNADYSRSNITDALEDGRHSPEKISFMKTLTNFLTDNGVGNLLPLESPLLPTEYVFPESCVVVREDEPSTIIAHTLSSEDYLVKMHEIQEFSSDNQSNDGTIKPGNTSLAGSKAPSISTMDNGGNPAPSVDGIQETLLRESGTHMRYNFSTGSSKFFCKIFFSEQFDALRRNCGCDESYIMSLASCIKWDSSGGKSGSAFLKTKNDRLLMKQMSKYELDAFLGFAPAYFQHMSEAFFRELPTVLAKIFGFYSIGYKNSVTGKSMRMDVLVMENLFYQRNIKKIFDLKGSMRNRHVQSTGKQDEVLLDENLVELIYQSPLFIRTHSKEILRSSLHNDTLFLSQRNVMDYSLLVGIDEERQELVVGIVDFIRTFTWDKKLESWVKESGILGGGGKGPTIVSPRQYRIRFREAMERYFLMVPDYWALTRQSQSSYAALHHHQIIQSDSDGE